MKPWQKYTSLALFLSLLTERCPWDQPTWIQKWKYCEDARVPPSQLCNTELCKMRKIKTCLVKASASGGLLFKQLNFYLKYLISNKQDHSSLKWDLLNMSIPPLSIKSLTLGCRDHILTGFKRCYLCCPSICSPYSLISVPFGEPSGCREGNCIPSFKYRSSARLSYSIHPISLGIVTGGLKTQADLVRMGLETCLQCWRKYILLDVRQKVIWTVSHLRAQETRFSVWWHHWVDENKALPPAHLNI